MSEAEKETVLGFLVNWRNLISAYFDENPPGDNAGVIACVKYFYEYPDYLAEFESECEAGRRLRPVDPRIQAKTWTRDDDGGFDWSCRRDDLARWRRVLSRAVLRRRKQQDVVRFLRLAMFSENTDLVDSLFMSTGRLNVSAVHRGMGGAKRIGRKVIVRAIASLRALDEAAQQEKDGSDEKH